MPINPALKKVLVLKQDILPYSETFIRDQMTTYRRWHSVLTGVNKIAGLPLDNLDICLLKDPARSLSSRIQWKLMRLFGCPPREALQKLKQQKPDLAHIHFGFDAVYFYPLVKHLAIPIVVTLHGYDINTYRNWWEKSADPVSARYPRRLLALARKPNIHFIAVSEAIRQTAIAYGIPEERIEVKYIGVNTSYFHPGPPMPEKKPRIVFIGRMVEKKGPNYLIEAFAKVRAQIPQAELVMIGDGPLLTSCKEMAAQLKLPVNFTEALPPNEIKNHLNAARVFCLPSITAENGDAEGLPIVILEAQASGVPVVTSARGGATEGIQHGVTGFAFPEKNTAMLADYLTQLLQDTALATSMSEKAPPFIAEKFDLHRCTQALEDYYDRLLAGKQA
jgi:glycosyltransferase involved in cell wall biosynthesis